MAKPLHDLRERLLRAGVAPRHVRRYLRELDDHLADLTAEEVAAGREPAEAETAALARLGTVDDLANAMIGRRELQSWAVRAPWATFGLGPLAALAGAYFIACFLLWWGWKLFVPAAATPFGYALPPTHAYANIYFLADKSWYFGAPIVIGLGLAMIAIRQRLKFLWPAIGLALIAYMGATAHIYAGRFSVAHGLGHIRMSFFSAPPSGAAASGELLYAAVIFALSVLPYV
ncbi:MAG: permease prefix domain 1-containing protein, partial [Candidatus Acidiferrales bacterium]